MIQHALSSRPWINPGGRRSARTLGQQQHETGVANIDADERRTNQNEGTADDDCSAECTLIDAALGILKRRRQRIEEFGVELFGEPAWEILLELYIREKSGASSTTAHVEVGLTVAASTAGRWLQHLEQEGLVALAPHPLHERTEFIELTSRAKEALERYLAVVGATAHTTP